MLSFTYSIQAHDLHLLHPQVPHTGYWINHISTFTTHYRQSSFTAN